MKKTVITTLSLLLFTFTLLPAQTNSADEIYIKAMTANNPAERAALLKDYVTKYAGKGTQYENFAYANLCTLAYKGKTEKETLEYGEKALNLGGLDDFTKYNVCITVASIYNKLGQNLEKAKNYALQSIQIAQTNKSKEGGGITPAQWNQCIGAGHYIHGQTFEKSKNLKSAADSYIKSYNILKNKQIANSLAKIGKALYDAKSYRDAERSLSIASAALKDFGSILLYAKTLHRNGKKQEALTYYKQAYTKRKSGEIAFNIGLILAENARANSSLSDEAIRYLLDASFLSQANSQKAMKLAEQLYFQSNKDLKFNEKVKELANRTKNLEDLTESFNKKYADKDEEDLSDAEKGEMDDILFEIDLETEAVEKLEAEQEAAIEKFSALIEQAKKRLGIS